MRAVAAALALVAAPAIAALTPAQLAQTGAAPPPGARLPHLAFIDQAARPFDLAPAPMPTVLLFADYSCRHICGPGLTLAAGALHDVGLRPGRDYRLVVIGLDQDGPARARAMAATHLRALPDEAHAAALLSGTPATIAAAEHSLGYHAAYDRAADQFAHDAAVFVFAADGRLSAVVTEMLPAQLPAAVQAAARGASYSAPGTANIGAICYGLATLRGPYAGAIVIGLRLGGLFTAAALGLLLARRLHLARREAR